MNTAAPPRSLYEVLAVELPQTDPGAAHPPETILTATIETVDNDRAYNMMGGVPVI